LHRKARRTDDEARCLVLLATCRRLAGDLDRASTAVERARRLTPGFSKASLEAAVEYAEVAAAKQDHQSACRSLELAITCRRRLELPRDNAEARLLRRRGLLFGADGQPDRAVADLREAASIFESIGESHSAQRMLVELATFVRTNVPDAFAGALAEARAAVADDAALNGELDLLEGAVAVDEGRLEDARTLTVRARDRALASVQPTLYIGSCLALAELADLEGDRVGAYETLAVGWVTLGDLVGRDVAEAVFEPQLSVLRQRWGDEAFDAARAAYADERRRILGQR
jgi:tetratricopeptide (TPR) repeat protein